MSDYDEMIASGNRQLEKLDAAMASANAEYDQAKVNGDPDAQDAALQDYCNLKAQKANVWNEYNQIVAAQWAAMPRQKTREEIIAAPLESLTPQERREWIRSTTKHGLNDDWYSAGEAYVAHNPSRGR